MPSSSVHTCITSPPYFGLRDYGHDGQIGLEQTPDEFVAKLVDVFREVRRVLRDDGTVWLNLGDSYAGAGPSGASYESETTKRRAEMKSDGSFRISKTLASRGLTYADKKPIPPPGLKKKDLIGIPWRVAFALQADGWYLRQDIIWHKPSPMPESVRDRCTKAHEYVFLLSKNEKYYFDAEAIKEPAVQAGRVRADRMGGNKYVEGVKHSDGSVFTGSDTRNKRSVWTVTTKPYKGAHFATFPPDLIEPCVLAGCPVGGTVLDPFGGAGTTGVVAKKYGRNAILCELNPEYANMARARIGASDA
jgi:DNA modification methylase